MASEGPLNRFIREIGDELKHQGKAGAHELASGILSNHDSYIQYPREEDWQAQKENEKDHDHDHDMSR